MKKIHFSMILIHIFGGVTQINCRKYDIETEAHKLFGENVETIVQRFRKTPEYRKLLNEKKQELEDLQVIIRNQVRDHFLSAMTSHLKTDHNSIPSKIHTYRRGIKSSYEYKLNDRLLRQGDAQDQRPKPLSDLVDSVIIDYSKTTAEEKNLIVNVAYQYFGNAIHAIIEAMGPDEVDEPGLSTRYSVYSNSGTTTKHPIVHTVTPAKKTTEITTENNNRFLRENNMPLPRAQNEIDEDINKI